MAVTLVASELNRAACAGFPPKTDDDDIYMGALTALAAAACCAPNWRAAGTALVAEAR